MRYLMPIVGVSETITVPVVTKVLKDLCVYYGIGVIPHVLSFDYIGYKKRNWVLRGKNSEMHGQRDKYIAYTVTEEPMDTTALSIGTSNNTPPLINDKSTGFRVASSIVDVALKLDIVFFTKSKTEADTLRFNLKNLKAKDRLRYMHDVQYYYHPHETLYSLAEWIANVKKEKLGLYKEDGMIPVDEYLKSIDIYDSLTYTDMVLGPSDKPSLAVRESQTKVLGNNTGEAFAVDKGFDESTGYWSVPMVYRFTFNRPETLSIAIDDYVHGVPFPYSNNGNNGDCKPAPYQRDRKMPWGDYFNSRTHPYWMRGMADYFMHPHIDGKVDKSTPYYIPVPSCDRRSDMELKLHSQYYLFSTILLSIDEGDTILMNLRDIPGYTFTDEVIAAMLLEKDRMIKLFQHLFFIEFRISNNPTTDRIYIDDDLNIVLVNPADSNIVNQEAHIYLQHLRDTMYLRDKSESIFPTANGYNKIVDEYYRQYHAGTRNDSEFIALAQTLTIDTRKGEKQ